jgi:hypothetical protein
MKGLAKRVRTVEERLPVGCATCCTWMPIVIEDDSGGRSRPDVCPECGRYMPATEIRMLIGIRWDDI